MTCTIFSNFYVLLFNLFAKAPSNQFLFWSSWDAHSSVPENTPLFFCFWSIFREILSHRNNDVNKTLTCPSNSRVTFFKWKWINTLTCFFTMEARSNFPKPKTITYEYQPVIIRCVHLEMLYVAILGNMQLQMFVFFCQMLPWLLIQDNDHTGEMIKQFATDQHKLRSSNRIQKIIWLTEESSTFDQRVDIPITLKVEERDV